MSKSTSLAISACPRLEIVERNIYIFRGQRVMLDADAAARFEVPTFRLREAVKRNRGRFPSDFMFELSAEEAAALLADSLQPQVGRNGRYVLPLAFTELGIAMLACVLRGERAAEASLAMLRGAQRKTLCA